ncbi:MAG: hypothetical protein ACOZNI_27825 [Myxococcota bacterium]
MESEAQYQQWIAENDRVRGGWRTRRTAYTASFEGSLKRVEARSERLNEKSISEMMSSIHAAFQLEDPNMSDELLDQFQDAIIAAQERGELPPAAKDTVVYLNLLKAHASSLGWMLFAKEVPSEPWMRQQVAWKLRACAFDFEKEIGRYSALPLENLHKALLYAVKNRKDWYERIVAQDQP